MTTNDEKFITPGVNRRHMTKGQRAAVAAKARLFLKNSQTKTAASIGTSQSQIAYANVVHEYAPPHDQGPEGGGRVQNFFNN